MVGVTALVGATMGVLNSMAVKKYKRFRDYCAKLMGETERGYVVNELRTSYQNYKGNGKGMPFSNNSAGQILRFDPRFYHSDYPEVWTVNGQDFMMYRWFLKPQYQSLYEDAP